MDRSNMKVQASRLGDEPREDDAAAMSPSERVAMVWKLTRTAWAFKGEAASKTRQMSFKKPLPIAIHHIGDRIIIKTARG